MYEIKMPQLGQSVEEATVVEWLKQEGDLVKQGEPLCTVQTDKAEIEVESTVSGVVRKLLVAPDETVPVLTVIALVGDPDEPLPDLDKYRAAPAAAKAEAEPSAVAVRPKPGVVPLERPAEVGRVLVSPRARTRAKELRVDPRLASGTGPRGRVVEADVVAYAERLGAIKVTPTARRLAAAKGVDVTAVTGTGVGGKITKQDVGRAAERLTVSPEASVMPEGKRVPLTPMRRVIAERMTASKFAAPHYYITVEVDVTEIVARYRSGGLAFKPSYNDLVLAGTVKALREYPSVNARWDGDAVIELADVNLGVAVALPTGLIVPVLRRAQTLSLLEIHQGCRELTDKARTGKLVPDDYVGNTFTVSNLGAYGVDHFTAIINQPDSAILAVGQIKDRPVVIEDGIQIRPIMKLTLSSDHRVVDGAMAAQFMGRLKEILDTADL